jgi:2-polyprenyl-3-methyl-5-hydroxy-6-metoxy-1,4-benzoquinol methylase
MNAHLLPTSRHWNRFWKTNPDSRFTRISWSKRRITALLDAIVATGMTLLDAGCGSGFFSRYVIERGCHVYSLDYSPDALEVTRKVTRGRSTAYLQADSLESNFLHTYSSIFDLIFTHDLLEHFTCPEQQHILDTFTVLKKRRGVVATFTPTVYSPWQLIRPILMPGIKEESFTIAGLRRCIPVSRPCSPLASMCYRSDSHPIPDSDLAHALR